MENKLKIYLTKIIFKNKNQKLIINRKLINRKISFIVMMIKKTKTKESNFSLMLL